jgi:hypothetical protein
MRIKKLAPAVIASMLALNLNFIGAGQAQAAACSKYDRGMWTDNSENNVNFFTAMAYVSQGVTPNADEYVNSALDLMDAWVKKTKSKKVKSAVIKFRTEFELGAELFDWKSNPQYLRANMALGSMFKLNRC